MFTYCDSPLPSWLYPCSTESIRGLLENVDYTMSYRRDDDIFAPYGDFVKREAKVALNFTVKQFESKKRSVAWMVSNCHTSSKRETYVEELGKYIDVDIYGICGSPISGDSETALRKIEKSYKFYLSFENSICPDYITEKVFRVMQYNVIPVVLGGAPYEGILPKNSFINALDFESPKLLAKYLDRIRKNMTLYASFFAWKRDYRVLHTLAEVNSMRRLCEMRGGGSRGSAKVGAMTDQRYCVDWRRQNLIQLEKKKLAN